ncbi:MAG: AI-2E family transporter [Lachnospiraceae bacterium]|nr:AI-2E family transporter [Lachnospiraceae bacterium]
METTNNDKGKYLLKLVLVITAVYIGAKYLLFIFLPFLIAYILKLILKPIVDYCENRFKINRKIFSIFLLIVILAVLITVFVLGIGILTKQVRKLVTNSGYYVEKVENITDKCCRTVEKYSGIESRDVKLYIEKGRDELIQKTKESGIAYTVMNKSVNIIIIIINGGIAIFTSVLAAYYMINKHKKDMYNDVSVNEKNNDKNNDNKQALLTDARKIVKKVTKVCVAYLKTELIIMFVTFLICFIAFHIIKNEYSFLFAVIVGILDSLPLIGVGTVLIPYALIKLLMEEYLSALIIVFTFILCYVFREITEPKLMGAGVGISPLATIVSIYTGLKVFGIIGVLLGPVFYIVVIEIMDMIKT